MRMRSLLSLCVASAVGFFAPISHGQAPASTTSASPPATATPSRASAATNAAQAAKAPTAASASTQGEKAPAGLHSDKHAKAHIAKTAAHKGMTGPKLSYNQDTPYRMALKRCVEGPAAQRDRCIDDAITRFGHM